MREITQQSQTLQVVSCENSFHKRVIGLERFIPKAYLRETYMVLYTWMNAKTRICWPGVCEIAARSGISRATVQRHLRKLEILGVVQTRMRRKSCRSNLTNVYFLPLLNEDFLRSRLRPSPPQNEAVIRIPKIKEQPTTARVAREEWKPDRETYRPRVGGCHMRFRDAWQLPSFQPHIINPKPDSELTLAEKVEIDETRKRIGLGPLYGVGGVQ